MYGSDFPMYLSLTCLTSSCSPFRKKSVSSNKMNLGFQQYEFDSHFDIRARYNAHLTIPEPSILGTSTWCIAMPSFLK